MATGSVYFPTDDNKKVPSSPLLAKALLIFAHMYFS
jgi:hypothetical protein